MSPGLKIGLLGAAAIAPSALINPARQVSGVTVTAVAARDRTRAEKFARKHDIPVVHADYETLLADPQVDAVYVPLPNSLHAEWTLKALQAGKHVLCEKPMTANRDEAERVAKAADAAFARSGLVVMEAFHYRHHPLAARMLEIANSGELGELHRVEAEVCFPLPRFSDIRYDYALAGGAAMDAGCYAVHAVRLLAGSDPTVTTAQMLTLRKDRRVDRAMTAELTFPGGVTGRVRASMWSRRVLSIRARAIGSAGELRVTNFVMPQLYHQLTVRASHDGGRVVRRERLPRQPSSYVCQLAAFTSAVRDGGPVITSSADAVANMGVLDEIYRSCGLPLRGERKGR
ncbi:Gfo/Idh/MocA family protein [Streptomyces sp. NPDC091972]|uniref:Gfo/Idh/MocA family protein n=1 Tax=Streptomyces sp. NPDC091972 TaxID=3366007 RepID=UPI00380CAE24